MDRGFYSVLLLLKKYRYAICGALFNGILAYAFVFTNKLLNHDELGALFTKGATVESGRWGLELMSLIFPDYSMPWIYGMISLFLITFGCCLCIRIFSIKSSLLQFVLAGVIVTFPSQAATFAYMFTASSYAVSFLLAIAAAYFVSRHRWSSFLLGILSAVISVSIYQAYISLTATVLVVLLIQQTLENTQSEAVLFKKGVCYILFLALSLGAYWLITKACWAVTGGSIGGYADDALNFHISTILDGIKNAYVSFYRILRYRDHLLITGLPSHIFHIGIVTVIAAYILFWIISQKNFLRACFLLFLLAILPLAMNCMYIFIDESAIHTLVLYSFAGLYILCAVILEKGLVLRFRNKLNRIFASAFQTAAVGVLVALMISNIYFANKAYLSLYQKYENTYSFTTSVLTNLQNVPGYTVDSKVAIIGSAEAPDYFDEHYSTLYSFWGFRGLAPDVYTIEYMFEYYNGVKLNFASGEEISAVKISQAFDRMPQYPNYGYIQEINGILVIKLSDVEPEE